MTQGIKSELVTTSLYCCDILFLFKQTKEYITVASIIKNVDKRVEAATYQQKHFRYHNVKHLC